MHQRTDQLKAICRVSRAFGTNLSHEELLHLILEAVTETMQVKAAILFLLDEERESFLSLAQRGLSETYLQSGFTSPAKIASLLEGVDCFFSEDAASDERLEHPEVKREEGISSLLLVPLRAMGGRVIGGLSLYTGEPRVFTQDEIDFATAMAEQASMGIEHTRLRERISQNTEILLDLAINIHSSLDLKKILHILTADVAEYFNVMASSILLMNEDRDTLEFMASYGLSEDYLNRGPLSMDKGVVETLYGKPVVISDALGDERVMHKEEKKREGIVSILSVPIKTGEKVIGVMRLYSRTRREFTKEEIRFASVLAHLGGLAIQNASLYLLLESDVRDLRENIWSHRAWF
jgi:GAF domain-containing protein